MRNFVLCVLLVVTISYGQQPSKSQPKPVVNDHPSERYAIFFSPHARADQYLVDTDTGRVWQKVTYTDLVGEPEVWMPLTRIDSDAQFDEWLKKQVNKSK